MPVYATFWDVDVFKTRYIKPVTSKNKNNKYACTNMLRSRHKQAHTQVQWKCSLSSGRERETDWGAEMRPRLSNLGQSECEEKRELYQLSFLETQDGKYKTRTRLNLSSLVLNDNISIIPPFLRKNLI